MRNAVSFFPPIFPPAESSNWIKLKGFSKAENRTWKVFVEHKNSKTPSKQVPSRKNHSSGPASDVSIVHCAMSSFYGPNMGEMEVKSDSAYRLA